MKKFLYYAYSNCPFTRLGKTGDTPREELLSAPGNGDVTVLLSTYQI